MVGELGVGLGELRLGLGQGGLLVVGAEHDEQVSLADPGPSPRPARATTTPPTRAPDGDLGSRPGARSALRRRPGPRCERSAGERGLVDRLSRLRSPPVARLEGEPQRDEQASSRRARGRRPARPTSRVTCVQAPCRSELGRRGWPRRGRRSAGPSGRGSRSAAPGPRAGPGRGTGRGSARRPGGRGSRSARRPG